MKEGEPDNEKSKEGSEPLEFIEAESIPAEISEVTLAQRHPCGQKLAKPDAELILRICANHQLYLINKSNQGVSISHGSIFVGFGKGKWISDCTGDAQNQIRYALEGSSDAVIYNGNKTSLGLLVSQKRLTCEADLARCCYHELVEAPKDGDKEAFDLKSTQNIFYVLQDVPVKAEADARTRSTATQNTAGSLIPPEHWNTNFTKLLWILKWMPKKGLQPIRPQITWMAPDTTIPASKALLLSNP